LQGEPQGKFPVIQKSAPKRYIKFVPTAFRRKPINYASQAPFDRNGSEFIFFAAFGTVVDSFTAPKTGLYLEQEIKGTLTAGERTLG